MDRQIKEPAIRRKRAEELADAFEQGCYWLLWAVVRVGLALGIFGLWNFTLPASISAVDVAY